jgi:hypothetical protein
LVLKLLADGEAIRLGHQQVENHQVRLLRVQVGQTFNAIPGCHHLIAIGFEEHRHCREDVKVVID